MRVCEGRKICPRKFKICPTFFELCALYFLFAQRGVKNTFHVLTFCPAPDSGFGMARAFKPLQTDKTCFFTKKNSLAMSQIAAQFRIIVRRTEF